MTAKLTRSQLIEQVAAKTALAKKDVIGVLEQLAEIGYGELKKNDVFLLLGLVKFVVIKKPATKAREGINSFNGEPMTFNAKPARRSSLPVPSKPPNKIPRNALLLGRHLFTFKTG